MDWIIVLTAVAVLVVTRMLSRLWKNRTVSAVECGHETKLRAIVSAWGEWRHWALGVKRGKTGYCLDCLLKMTIRCGWCREPIFVGDQVMLYSVPPDARMPEHAVLYDEKTNTYVGCARSGCVRDAPDGAGLWHPPGQVRRLMTLEQIAQQAFKDGKKDAIIVRLSNR